MTRWFLTAVTAALILVAGSASAQTPRRDTRAPHDAFPVGVIEGRVRDEQQVPVVGAMVSIVGRITVAATTDRTGRYSVRNLPYGPYILSVHSRGFFKSRGRTVQVTTPKLLIPEIQLARAADAVVPARISQPLEPAPQLAGFGVDAAVGIAASDPSGATDATEADEDGGETAWRVRHLPRSILRDAATEAVWTEDEPARPDWLDRTTSTVVPLAFFSDLPLSGQVNLLTTESFDRPGDIFGTNAARSVAFVSVNTRAAGGSWSMKGAMTQGDLSSWIVAGSYKSIHAATHAYELGMSYSTQRYDGGNATALGAIRDSARNVGSIYGYDEWTISPRFILGYGTGFARYDYLPGAGVWSPRLTVTVPLDGFRIKALASQKALVPGAEEFAPSVTGIWLPPERTFSSLSRDGRFTAEQTRHAQVAIERDLAPGVTVALRGFDQRTTDQLAEIFDSAPGRSDVSLGHYYVTTTGDVDARGWGVRMSQEMPGYVRATMEYTVATAYWQPGSDISVMRAVRTLPQSATEKVHDLQTTIEATIPQTSTRVYATYRVNTAFWSDEPDAYLQANSNARFNVRVNQALPFLQFSNADWEALLDIRNMFREAAADGSIYDEAFAIRAPKRIVGGLLVKF
jgi:hypothetical protein